MGIPKFFRHISERYPLVSQLIEGDRSPEFDNLYLDFNEIIHQCCHDDDAHSRISEEKIFTSIFLYVDHLFEKIRPKKLFYVAVDGVAPRAKMNQQRSRRFRTAKDSVTEELMLAEMRGEKVPDTKAFDTNCVTPGTLFMSHLSERLKYYVNKKITDDANWRNVEVILSGPDVPGEGEHKIMEYIRHVRVQPGYDPNTRHCLYGLDADLIMLGLVTHEPHFCLLREEVRFGPDPKRKGRKNPDSIKYYLFHLSLMREYLDIEFRDLEPMLPFRYSLENVIDDFILLAVFVGNDFLPDLPGFHIQHNGLEIYKTILPSLDGYINEGGTISLKRLQVLLDEMSTLDEKAFEKGYGYLKYFRKKQEKYMTESPVETKRNLLWDEFGKGNDNIVTWSPSSRIPGDDDIGEFDVREYDDMFGEVYDSSSSSLSENGTGSKNDNSLLGVVGTNEAASIMHDNSHGGAEGRSEREMREKVAEWKRRYYWDKMKISYNNDLEEIRKVAHQYIKGVQWVIKYYYGGVPSWEWFYDYHYAPRVSDLRDVEDINCNFDLGQPFRPFEQLMAVLPPASRELVPLAFRDLMCDVNSPLLHFYPPTFEQDLDGRKHAWEAVVKIPFIDEKRLLEVMAGREHRLTPEERHRNISATPLRLTHSHAFSSTYPSPTPNKLPSILRCHCRMEQLHSPVLVDSENTAGFLNRARLGTGPLAGFPSLTSLPHFAVLDLHDVNVYGTESTVHKSRNNSVSVKLNNTFEGRSAKDVAEDLIGGRIFTGWPFWWEGLVATVSDSSFRYEKFSATATVSVVARRHTIQDSVAWKSAAQRIEWVYSNRKGVATGPVHVLLHVRPLTGTTVRENGDVVKVYGPEREAVEHAVQTCSKDPALEDPRFMEIEAMPLEVMYPKGTPMIYLGGDAYGAIAHVRAAHDESLSILLEDMPLSRSEAVQFKSLTRTQTTLSYLPSYRVAYILNITPRALSRITSSFLVTTSDKTRVNVGLNMKFDAKSFKVIGYTRKDGRHWEYSQKAIDLISDYKASFPEIFKCLDYEGDTMLLAFNVFENFEPEERLREIKRWLIEKSAPNFEQVPLICDQLSKEITLELEQLARSTSQNKSTVEPREMNVPTRMVLKPEHAIYRLTDQKFELGDRVRMVKRSGAVPFAEMGVVVGIELNSIDVLWDDEIYPGTTLDDRCSDLRGMTIDLKSALNLSTPQFIVSLNITSPASLISPLGVSNKSHLPQSYRPRGTAPWSRDHTSTRGHASGWLHPTRGFTDSGMRGSALHANPSYPPIINIGRGITSVRGYSDSRSYGGYQSRTGISYDGQTSEWRAGSSHDGQTSEWRTITRRGRPPVSTQTTSDPSVGSTARGRGFSVLSGPGFVLPSADTARGRVRGSTRRGRGRG